MGINPRSIGVDMPHYEIVLRKNGKVQSRKGNYSSQAKAKPHAQMAADKSERGVKVYIEEKRDNPLRLTKADKAVIGSFLAKRGASSKKLHTDGRRLDGLWMGGSGIATWSPDGRHIVTEDLGSKAAETVQRSLAKMAPSNWMLKNPNPKPMTRKEAIARVEEDFWQEMRDHGIDDYRFSQWRRDDPSEFESQVKWYMEGMLDNPQRSMQMESNNPTKGSPDLRFHPETGGHYIKVGDTVMFSDDMVETILDFYESEEGETRDSLKKLGYVDGYQNWYGTVTKVEPGARYGISDNKIVWVKTHHQFPAEYSHFAKMVYPAIDQNHTVEDWGLVRRSYYRTNPDSNWVQEADEEIEEKGTEGAFTAQARRAGYSDTMDFAHAVMKGWKSGKKKVYNKKTRKLQGITKTTMLRANFAINVQKRQNPFSVSDHQVRKVIDDLKGRTGKTFVQGIENRTGLSKRAVVTILEDRLGYSIEGQGIGKPGFIRRQNPGHNASLDDAKLIRKWLIEYRQAGMSRVKLTRIMSDTGLDLQTVYSSLEQRLGFMVEGRAQFLKVKGTHDSPSNWYVTIPAHYGKRQNPGPWHNFKRGDLINIESGPLMGSQGVVESVDTDWGEVGILFTHASPTAQAMGVPKGTRLSVPVRDISRDSSGIMLSNPGRWFVIVDVSEPGGRWAGERKIFTQPKLHEADAQALAMEKSSGRRHQVIDAEWFRPAREVLAAQGLVSRRNPADGPPYFENPDWKKVAGSIGRGVKKAAKKTGAAIAEGARVVGEETKKGALYAKAKDLELCASRLGINVEELLDGDLDPAATLDEIANRIDQALEAVEAQKYAIDERRTSRKSNPYCAPGPQWKRLMNRLEYTG